MGESEPKRAWLPYAISGLILLCVFAVSPNFLGFDAKRESPFAGDFLQEWIGSHIVWNHGAASLYDVALVKKLQHDSQLVGFVLDKDSYFLMVYPPFYYVLLSPIAMLPYDAAAWIFAAVMVACLYASAKLMRSAVPDFRRDRFAWLFVAAIVFVPLLDSLTSGQKGTLCLLILRATFYLLKQDRPALAGLVFGLMAFKPQLAIVIGAAMLLKGQWRFAASAVGAALFLAAICLASGFDVCVQYYEFCTGVGDYVHIGGYELAKSHCLYGFLTLLAGGQATATVKVAALSAIAVVFAILMVSLRGKLDTTSRRFNVQFSVLVISTLLISPHLFTYDLTMLLLPMFLLGHAAQTDAAAMGAKMTGLLIAMFVVAGFSYNLAAISGLQMTTVVMLAILWVSVNSRIRGAEPVTDTALGSPC